MINNNELETISVLCAKYGAGFLKNAPLAALTTFKIGGACDILIKVNCRELLREIVLCCKNNNTPFYVIGKGSNILVRDEGVRGVVLLLADDFADVRINNDKRISCLAGASLMAVCVLARNNSLTGFEFAYGIPGSVGGAVFMNAGAYDGEIADVLSGCEFLDEDCEIKTLELEKEKFSHRKSPFTGTKKIVLSAEFLLEDGEKMRITAKMDDFIARRRNKQPLEFPSAGSTFKRPEGDYASRLIDICGLKGFSVGGAEVSEKHAGFIINKGGATCNDVLKLIEAVKERVLKETGITLEREVQIMQMS
ncbi:MAG: UDP-N-acetylmuramate dehydrogenase [Oscillospiraceae bacterium]|nr:UDP-N-acetylmuramate dehydrogenase [Oscillospiraceae bacterium]